MMEEISGYKEAFVIDLVFAVNGFVVEENPFCSELQRSSYSLHYIQIFVS